VQRKTSLIVKILNVEAIGFNHFSVNIDVEIETNTGYTSRGMIKMMDSSYSLVIVDPISNAINEYINIVISNEKQFKEMIAQTIADEQLNVINNDINDKILNDLINYTDSIKLETPHSVKTTINELDSIQFHSVNIYVVNKARDSASYRISIMYEFSITMDGKTDRYASSTYNDRLSLPSLVVYRHNINDYDMLQVYTGVINIIVSYFKINKDAIYCINMNKLFKKFVKAIKPINSDMRKLIMMELKDISKMAKALPDDKLMDIIKINMIKQ